MRHLSHKMKKKAKSGRAEQKAKTKVKILKATKALLQLEKPITLEDIALEAHISRATIYRYYSNIDLLITEATLEIHHKSPEAIFKESKGKALDEQLLDIQEQYNQFAAKNETVFRRYLSAVLSESLSNKEKIRGARRIKTLEKVLGEANSEISAEDRVKLKNVGALLMGIDALVVCKDVCGLNNQETNDTLKWAMQMILKGIKS